ncbi:MAG: ABC transporter ATP-binding protein [Cyanobacteriota bacterium]|nr:ABC transporter ATP-binding protein [Cyanobacteriota bacterium]
MPLSAQNLSGGYGKTTIVEAIDLTLEQGEWLSLLGANGSGKSTLLRLMSRILAPQNGVVLLDGKAIHHQPMQAVARQLAILPQQQTVPPGLTVEQLVSLGRAPYQNWWEWELDEVGKQKVEEAMLETGVIQFSDRPVAELSGGEKQRVFLALALAQNPKVLLLDEPTTYLDVRYQLQLLDLLKDLNQKQELAIITVLHDINLAARYSDRLALLRQGRLFGVGAVNDILTPENVAAVFDVEAIVLETPVGVQICPISDRFPLEN